MKLSISLAYLLIVISILGLATCTPVVNQPISRSSNKSSTPPLTIIPREIPIQPQSLADTLIAFHYYQDENYHIYTMKIDGSSVKQITNNKADDTNPTWSPDGLKMAFQSKRDGNWEIYVMNSDGSKQTRLTFDSTDDEFPTWSPDGSKITFVTSRHGYPQIYIMKANGADQTRITKDLSWYYKCPAWSPDGSKIAFSASPQGYNYNGHNGIYLMAPSGSDTFQLTPQTNIDLFPSWSPNGSSIVYTHFYGNRQIWSMNVDGLKRTLLSKSDNPGGEDYPSWSPNGSKIVYSSPREGSYDFYIMNADGSGQTKISNLKTNGVLRPCWSPFFK